MTPRDFCYWLQGYFEIQLPQPGSLTAGVWNTIVEHLTLTIKQEQRSDPEFNELVDNLWGFVQINGRGCPDDEQWAHIRVGVSNLFIKVTSPLPHPAHFVSKEMSNEELKKAWKRILDKWDDEPTEHPLPSSELDLLTPICSGEKLCRTTDGDKAYCISAVADEYSANNMPAIADGPYPAHEDDRLGRDPLK